MTVYLNVAHHGLMEWKMFNSRCSKMTVVAFLKPFGRALKASPRTLFITSVTLGCFWCFISSTNQTFCLTRWKFLTSRHYFDPWLYSLILLLSLYSEIPLNIMLFSSKCWRKVFMGAFDVSLIILDKIICKIFSNNS